jgi:2-methylfumaryl-CoA hydratase
MRIKSRNGNHFEHFRIGMFLSHPDPRTLTEGDRSLCAAQDAVA